MNDTQTLRATIAQRNGKTFSVEELLNRTYTYKAGTVERWMKDLGVSREEATRVRQESIDFALDAQARRNDRYGTNGKTIIDETDD
jgi:hypothetical protein